MKIRIIPENREKINDEIEKVEGAARARLAHYGDLEELLKRIDKRLADIPKKHNVGTVGHYSEPVNCNSYGSYRCESTVLKVERFPTGWFFVGARRTERWTRNDSDSWTYSITPSRAAREYVEKIAVEELMRDL